MSETGFQCCDTEVPWPEKGTTSDCPECGTVWEHDGVDLGGGARIREPGYPDNFQGSGPLYAAVPLGEPWYQAASHGATTYVMEAPAPGATEAEAIAAHQAYSGNSAFLDRGQVEQISDARGDGTFTRWEGLTGRNDWSARLDAELRQADADLGAYLDSLEAGS